MNKNILEKYPKEIFEIDYLVNGLSYRQLNEKYGINVRTSMKLLKFYGINPRRGSEAIKNQWIGEKGENRKNKIKENRKFRVVTSDGYYEILFEGEHKSKNKGRVKEHILVMEDMIGRRLEKGEVVHHIDGNKKNNSPYNLQLMTASEHSKHHGKDSGEKIKKLHKEGKLKIIRGEKGRINGVIKI